MSTRRISSAAGFVDPKKLPRGSGGRALCRVCGAEVPLGRRTFCSQACVHRHKLTTNPTYVRRCVFDRDRGVCAVCGLDTVATEQALARKIMENKRTVPVDWSRNSTLQLEFITTLGARFGTRRTAGYWDADHIVAVVLGGGECGLENYRTLCIPCHHAVTRELRASIAHRKKS